jgi:hypothetical protein
MSGDAEQQAGENCRFNPVAQMLSRAQSILHAAQQSTAQHALQCQEMQNSKLTRTVLAEQMLSRA